MTIRILIADDHEIVRDGLRTLLELDPELVVVGEATDGHEAVDAARRLRPDVVLMDLLMPHMDGLTATRLIRAGLPGTEVIALTSVLESTLGMGAVEAGAMAFLLKDTRAAELRKAIRAAAAGQVQLSSRLTTRLTPETAATPLSTSLSDVDTEILRMLANGYTNAEMARAMATHEDAMRSTVNAVLTKLNVLGRAQAVLVAERIGLCSGRRAD
jgi:DNA-binding NarL/FixJ family response regulator